MTYIPILRTVVRIQQYFSRILRDKTFYARIRLKHWRKKYRSFHRKLQGAVLYFLLKVAPDSSMLKIPEPPVPHLLLSNDAPNSKEIDLVRIAIQEAKDERLRLKAELFLGLATNFTDLVWETVIRHKISCVVTFIDQHQGVVSPLRRLPPELLQCIFLFAVPTCTNVPRNWISVDNVPWRLGQVCRTWRKSALCYSPLWSYFPKLELRATKSRTAMQLEMVTELLHRSGIAPLNIYVDALPETYRMHSHPTLELLTKTSERWLTAAFGLSTNLSPCLYTVEGRLPLLEHLFFHDHVETRIQSLQLDAFSIAPRLRAVNISVVHHLILPIEQLVSCKVKISASHFLEQVLQCPTPCPLENLTVLELLDSHLVTPVTFPRLITLKARFWTSQDTSVLQKFTLPVIEDIRIQCRQPGVLIQNLISMLSNCEDRESTLKRLGYRIPVPEDEGFSDLLALVPNLIELDANLPKRAHIQNLIDGYMGRGLVPLLETCKLYVNRDQAGSEMADVLNDLAESRCELMNVDATVWNDAGEGESSTFRFPGEVRPLRSLLVYSEDAKAIHLLHGCVNGYTVTPTYESLNSVWTQLSQIVMESATKTRTIRCSELDDVLDSIEKISVQHVEDIYVRASPLFSSVVAYNNILVLWSAFGPETVF